jgi:hypothetical protein
MATRGRCFAGVADVTGFFTDGNFLEGYISKVGLLATVCRVSGTVLMGVTDVDSFSGLIRKCINSPAAITSNTKIDTPARTLTKELWNNFFFLDFLRIFFLRVAFRFVI